MLIVIEGSIGAGKTTIARGLSMYRNSGVLLESFESNPFLSAFYSDPAAYALETEFMFLLLHFRQLKSQLAQISSSELIADFHLAKDLLYADLNLTDARPNKIFKELYAELSDRVPKPQLMICLSASTELLIKRITKRQRDLEKNIDPKYCASVNAAYEDFFAQYPGRKVMISMDECDFVQSPALFEGLSVAVDEQFKQPTENYTKTFHVSR